jgi:hypothetical protein
VPHSAPRFLHVANGNCTTRLIEAAGIPGTLSIWADPLYEGPVPGGLTDQELLHVRARFLAEPTAAAYADTVQGLKAWRAVIDDTTAYDELVLWFEHDLFDQLNLVQLLTCIGGRRAAENAVSLVCIGSFPGHPRFKGLGELAPHELATLLDKRERVRPAQYALAARAWEAFRDSTPTALEELQRSDTSALPFLSAAIRRFLEEYPSVVDGLSRTERRLLELAGEGPIALRSVFPRMHDGENAYYVTDSSLADLALALSRTSPPLIACEPVEGTGPTLQTTITLGDFGREVLAGRRDRVDTCGIDRWLGGVHLQAAANEWRWDDRLSALSYRR